MSSVRSFNEKKAKRKIDEILVGLVKGWEMNIKWLLITGAIILLFYLLYVKLKDFVYYW